MTFFFNLFAINDINSTLKQISLNAHASQLLNESSFSCTVRTTNLDVLSLFFTGKFLENLVYFFPFSIDTGTGIVLQVIIDIVSLSKTRRQVFERAFLYFDDISATLPDIYFEILKVLLVFVAKLVINFNDSSIIVFGVYQCFYESFGKLNLGLIYFKVMLDNFA